MVKKYTTNPADQWDKIAKNVYGEERYAHLLMMANPDYIGIYQFDAGTQINVPNLTENESNLPEWRR